MSTLDRKKNIKDEYLSKREIKQAISIVYERMLKFSGYIMSAKHMMNVPKETALAKRKEA